MLSGMYREIEALGGAPIMDDYDEGYTDGLNDALAVLRKHGFGVDLVPGPQWQPIESAPKNATQVLLWCCERYHPVVIGSFRVDEGFADDKSPLWLDNSYDDFSCGYASTPLSPTHWIPLPSPPTKEEDDAPTHPN